MDKASNSDIVDKGVVAIPHALNMLKVKYLP